jgi:hypothetical protein
MTNWKALPVPVARYLVKSVICHFVIAPMAGAGGASAIRAWDICAAIPASVSDTPPAKRSLTPE